MNGPPRPAAVDINAMAAQQKVIDAQKDLEALKMSQQARGEKANKAINFVLLPYQGKNGMIRWDPEDTPESKAARAAAYGFLADYFGTTTDFEDGLPVRQREVDESPAIHSA